MLLETSKTFVSRDFGLEKGGALPELTVAYETYGTHDPARENTILLCHGYTSSPHAAGDGAGWWNALIGPGKAMDTDRYHVVASNMIGSAYGSTAPASTDPATGRPYGSAFPEITIGDMIAAQCRLLDHLGVGRLAAVVGFSYGGYLTFQWAVRHPKRMRALVPVATGIKGRGGPETVTALRDRFAKCPDWNGGDYYGREAEKGGVRDELVALRRETLRNYGLVEILTDRLGSAAEAEAAIDRLARQWAREFDANSLIVLRQAAIGHDARPKAAAIKAPLLYVLSRSDALFPPDLAEPTLALLREAGVDASYFEIDSEYGHRAPSDDWHKWAEPLKAFLDRHAG